MALAALITSIVSRSRRDFATKAESLEMKGIASPSPVSSDTMDDGGLSASLLRTEEDALEFVDEVTDLSSDDTIEIEASKDVRGLFF
jgi:hypothetical protein